jgi:hypothetical protein
MRNSKGHIRWLRLFGFARGHRKNEERQKGGERRKERKTDARIKKSCCVEDENRVGKISLKFTVGLNN